MVPVLLVMICFSSWLLVAEIPMFALKFKHWGWKENELRYTFIVFSAVMIYFFGIIQSFWMIVAWYFIVSLCSNMMTKKAQA